jgi:hypothetical protein
MAATQDRRRGKRLAVAGHPGGRVRATLEARLIDLSASGARIQHQNLLRPGFACTLEFPASLGDANVPVQVVRSVVIGTGTDRAGERKLRYESGLQFGNLTPEQRARVEAILERLVPKHGLGDGRLVLSE